MGWCDGSPVVWSMGVRVYEWGGNLGMGWEMVMGGGDGRW